MLNGNGGPIFLIFSLPHVYLYLRKARLHSKLFTLIFKSKYCLQRKQTTHSKCLTVYWAVDLALNGTISSHVLFYSAFFEVYWCFVCPCGDVRVCSKSLIKTTRARIEVVRRRAEAKQRFLNEDLAKLLSNGLDINAYGRVPHFTPFSGFYFLFHFINLICSLFDCFADNHFCLLISLGRMKLYLISLWAEFVFFISNFCFFLVAKVIVVCYCRVSE